MFVIHLWIVQSTGKGVSVAYFSVTKIGVWAIIEYWLQGGYKITMSDLEILQLYLGRLFISVHYYREEKKEGVGRIASCGHVNDAYPPCSVSWFLAPVRN